MKTILRILTILVVAAVVAGAFFLTANNSSISSVGNEGRQLPTMTNANGQSFQPLERPEGRREGGSLTGGLVGVLGTVAELGGITILVLLIQKAFNRLGNARLSSIQR